MTDISVQRDVEALSLVFTTDLAATPSHAWELWSDPRQLERWWGPPEFPATFVEHELAPGTRTTYFMTGPNGEHAGGWWRILATDPPDFLEFENGFSHEDDTPDLDSPVSVIRMTLEPLGPERTRMVIATRFASVADLERIVSMGFVEGLSAAMGQIGDILAGA